MARIPNLKLTESEVSQEIDLKAYLGIDVSKNAPMKAAIGQWMIDRILERTSKSEDAFGKSFQKYSSSYKKSLMFQAYKGSSRVNMELTGEMLSSIDVMADKGNSLTIGISDQAQAAKAYGHMTGMQGHPTLDGVTPKRMFFGVTEDDLKAMKKEFTPDTLNGGQAEDDSVLLKLTKRVDQLLGGLFGSKNQGG